MEIAQRTGVKAENGIRRRTGPLCAGNFKTLDTITTDGSQSYTLNCDGVAFQPGQAERLIVSLDGVTQAPNVAFTINGSTITFAACQHAATSTVDDIVALR